MMYILSPVEREAVHLGYPGSVQPAASVELREML